MNYWYTNNVRYLKIFKKAFFCFMVCIIWCLIVAGNVMAADTEHHGVSTDSTVRMNMPPFMPDGYPKIPDPVKQAFLKRWSKRFF